MAFQSTMNNQPAVGIEGNWCSANPRSSTLSRVGGFTAGPGGVTIGRFAWADVDGVVRNSGGVGRLGFVHYDNLALIQNWLGRTSLLIPAGYEMAMHSACDVWCRFAAGASPGQKVFANYADGSAVAGTAGSPPSAASATGVITAATAAMTASIGPAMINNGDEPGGVMTVTAVSSGTIYPGSTLTGTGVGAGNLVLAQLTSTETDGHAGGKGTYEVSQGVQVASSSLGTTYGLLTISGTVTGTFGVGDVLSGTGVVAGSQISALGSGTGGDGTYVVNNNTAVSSTTISAAAGQESSWYVDSVCAAGELAQISTHP